MAAICMASKLGILPCPLQLVAGPVYIIHSFIHTFIAQNPVFMVIHSLTAEGIEFSVVTQRLTTRTREQRKARTESPYVKE
jgi:hypothetical protein